jgi:response regulator of citrate/malate metabolism
MSAIEELQLVYQCLSKGATDYIVKPVRQQQVQNLWQNVWRKRQEQKLLGMYELEKGQKREMVRQYLLVRILLDQSLKHCEQLM